MTRRPDRFSSAAIHEGPNVRPDTKGQREIMHQRRQPIYFVIDLTMPPAVRSRILNRALMIWRCDPQALEIAYLSVICFAEKAAQVVPLTNLIEFDAVQLSANNICQPMHGGALGEGLVVLTKAVESEVRKGNFFSKGDYRPVVFVLCYREPNDNWRAVLNDLRVCKLGAIVLLAPESVISKSGLTELTECVFPIESTNDGLLETYFRMPFQVSDGPIEEY